MELCNSCHSLLGEIWQWTMVTTNEPRVYWAENHQVFSKDIYFPWILWIMLVFGGFWNLSCGNILRKTYLKAKKITTYQPLLFISTTPSSVNLCWKTLHHHHHNHATFHLSLKSDVWPHYNFCSLGQWWILIPLRKVLNAWPTAHIIWYKIIDLIALLDVARRDTTGRQSSHTSC